MGHQALFAHTARALGHRCHLWAPRAVGRMPNTSLMRAAGGGVVGGVGGGIGQAACVGLGLVLGVGLGVELGVGLGLATGLGFGVGP
jgi:hypothetical protein